MIDAALQTSGLCDTAAPPRPPLRYGMETTDLLLCLGGVTREGIPARRGGFADLCFCFAPRDRKTYYMASPLRGCEGTGQITAGAVSLNNSIVVVVEAEDKDRRKRLDIYRSVCRYVKVLLFISFLLRESELPSFVSGTVIQKRTDG